MSAIGALVARRWQLVHVIVGDDAGRGGALRALHSKAERTTDDVKTLAAPSDVCWVRPYLFGVRASFPRQAAEHAQSMSSLSLPPKVWQWMRESAAMTRMIPGAAEVMPEVSPVPLL